MRAPQHDVATTNVSQEPLVVVERLATAYASLFAQQCSMVCRRYGVDWATAECIVQQAYVNLLRRATLAQITDNYVWRTVRNAALDHLRWEHRQCRDARRTRPLTDYLLNTLSGSEVQ